MSSPPPASPLIPYANHLKSSSDNPCNRPSPFPISRLPLPAPSGTPETGLVVTGGVSGVLEKNSAISLNGFQPPSPKNFHPP